MASIKTLIKGNTPKYEDISKQFATDVRSKFGTLSNEISTRNSKIQQRDDYIYGDRLQRSLDIPVGHDFTSVNWLRRTVEIHKNMFMSRGFQVISTYDTETTDNVDDSDRRRIEIENSKRKSYAEQRKTLIDSIIRDNGGNALWATLAENASAVGDAALKAYYDTKNSKYVLSQIEAVENLYVLWKADDFREPQAYAYVYQVSKSTAISEYGASDDVATSTMGAPLAINTSTETNQTTSSPYSDQKQPMVTIIEFTGVLEGWSSESGKCKQVKVGSEKEFNALIVGDKTTRIIDDPKKIPRYYLLPNKRQRRRGWGMSDVSDEAINLNQTYVEIISDWRTVAAKVNFQKYKAYGFAPGTTLPKSESRKIQMLPMAEGQDIVPLDQGDSNQIDWRAQADEIKEQFVRETGLSRVLFDDPSVTFNSNQALLTSMKPTSDIAEAKKQSWSPIITQIFTDALETIALYEPEIKEVVDEEENWSLKVMWPSVMQKEDPMYQSMLLNRFNAGTMSMQTYLEAQGETKEEIDRLKDEITDPVTSAILGKQLPLLAQTIVNAATAEIQAWYQATLPQKPEQGNTPGVSANGGVAAVTPTASPAENIAGAQPVSQVGTGATVASAGGAVAQAAQNGGL